MYSLSLKFQIEEEKFYYNPSSENRHLLHSCFAPLISHRQIRSSRDAAHMRLEEHSYNDLILELCHNLKVMCLYEYTETS